MVTPLRRCHGDGGPCCLAVFLASFRRRVIPWLIWSEPGRQVWGGSASPWHHCRPCRARHLGLVARRDLSAAGLSGHAGSRASTFTRGSASARSAPTERQELMYHATRSLSEFGLSPRFLGGRAVACSYRLTFPEASGGPLPASLASP